MHAESIRRSAQAPIGIGKNASDEALLEFPLGVIVADASGNHLADESVKLFA